MRARKSVREYVRWMPWVAVPVERINQGVLAVGLEGQPWCLRAVALALPVGWNGSPSVLPPHVFPTRCDRDREATEGPGDDDGKHREWVVTYGHRGQRDGVYNTTTRTRGLYVPSEFFRMLEFPRAPEGRNESLDNRLGPEFLWCNHESASGLNSSAA